MRKICPYCGASLVGGSCNNSICGGAKTRNWGEGEPTRKDQPKSRSWIGSGYIVALLGVALFALFGPFGHYLAGENELLEKQLVYLGLVCLLLGFVIGAILISIDKRYPVFLGLVLGVFSPLGLLILALLPPPRIVIDDSEATGT